MPAAIASLCFFNGKAGIYNVGAKTDYRGNGFGTKITEVCTSQFLKLNGDILFLQSGAISDVERWHEKVRFDSQFFGQIYERDYT